MLKSLYIKALNNRRYIQPEPEKSTDFSLEGKWFDKPFAKSKSDFSIAAGDGSFNIKKFLLSHEIKNFVILDDMPFDYKKEGLLNMVILVCVITYLVSLLILGLIMMKFKKSMNKLCINFLNLSNKTDILAVR